MRCLIHFKSCLIIFFSVFSCLIEQKFYASHYAIEKTIDVGDSSSYASSIVWIDASKDGQKFLTVVHEILDENSLAVQSFVRIFDRESSAMRYEFFINKDIEIKRAIFNRDDRYIHAIASNKYDNGRITTLNASKPFAECEKCFIETVEKLNCLAISPDGTLLVVGGDDEYLNFLNPFSLEPELELQVSKAEISVHEKTTALNFNQNGEKIISAHQSNHSSLIRIYHKKTGECEFFLDNKNYWDRNNIRSIGFNPIDENLIHFTIASKFYTFNKDNLVQSFFHKIYPDHVAIDSEGMMVIVNRHGQLRELIENNTYKPKLSEHVIKINKQVPLIIFKDDKGLKTIMGASDYNKYSEGPAVFIYKQVPSFRDIQKRQIIGALPRLCK